MLPQQGLALVTLNCGICVGTAASPSSGDAQQASWKALATALGKLIRAKEAKASPPSSLLTYLMVF